MITLALPAHEGVTGRFARHAAVRGSQLMVRILKFKSSIGSTDKESTAAVPDLVLL